MNKNLRRHIFWMAIAGMICCFTACNNDSVSVEQSESFLKYYAAGTDENTGTKVVQTPGGYAILGNFENVTGFKDIFVIFTDEYGRQKTAEPTIIGNPNLNNHGFGMIRLGDGFLICGSSSNESATRKWGYLVNISSDGTVLWERQYSGNQELEFRDAFHAVDGHLIMTGYSISSSGNDTEVIYFKTETDGDSLRYRSYFGPNFDDVGVAIIEHQNRYHILTTRTDINSPSLTRIRMLNTNTDGWGLTSEPLYTDYLSGRDITINDAGRMFILGNLEDPASRVSRIFLAELILTGSESNITNLGHSTSTPDLESWHAASFSPVGTEALAIGGWQETNQLDNDILFLEVDNNFQVQKRLTYGSQGSQRSQDIIFTDDQGYALTGSVDLAGQKTSMLLKINSEGELK